MKLSVTDFSWLPPSAESLRDKRDAWFKSERERAESEGRKALPCSLKTRAQLLELWRKRIERSGNNGVYVGCGRVRSRGVSVSVSTHSRGSASASQVAVVKPESCESGCVVTVTPTAPTVSTPAVIEAVVKPSWVIEAERVVQNVEFVGFEAGEPVFRLKRAAKRMRFVDGEAPEVALLRPKGFRSKRIEKIEKEESWFMVGWDSDDLEVFVERS